MPDIPTATALSDAAQWVWAKTHVDDNGVLDGWLPLHTHLDDSAAVAGQLWDHWATPAVRRQVARPFDGDETIARALYVWLASIHDLGKASPGFSVQSTGLAEQMAAHGLAADMSLAGTDERRAARHEIVSHFAVSDWLKSQGAAASIARGYGSILGAHHGLPPDDTQVKGARHSRLSGDESWKAVRLEFLTLSAERHASPALLQLWCTTALPEPVQVLLSGLVIMADWIASGDHFPQAELRHQPRESTEERVRTAWRLMEIPGPWVPAPIQVSAEVFFHRRFGIRQPHETQKALMDLAETVDNPSLMILEAPMGGGKTEAALAAAEVLAGRFGSGGIFIALPTQATTDGMFARVHSWARSLNLAEPHNIFLAHGKSTMNTEFAALRRDVHYGSVGADRVSVKSARDVPDAVIAHWWFSQPKRGPLANFVIGTIDQILFTSLRSRHLMMRHLAVAGKVVIIDEAHAFSTHMNVYLDRALHWLASYDVPVILLSATLPPERRRALVAAYDAGRLRSHPEEHPVVTRGEGAKLDARHDVLVNQMAYPSIVASRGADAPLVIEPPEIPRTITVAIRRLDDGRDALIDLLQQALRDGGCVAVIRNTVDRVQDTANYLREAFPDAELTVAHARFTAGDRVERDALLLNKFGPPTPGRSRPRQHIVVASQVIEQSLDIDFDLMVTDLAPVDLLLQRVGRLHRHQRGAGQGDRPQPLRSAQLVITGVNWESTPPAPDKTYLSVYPMSLLLRTLAVLRVHSSLELPHMIPGLVSEVYGTADMGPDEWQGAMHSATVDHHRALEASRQTAQAFLLNEPAREFPSLIGWVNAEAADPAAQDRGRASVRDGEESLEVLLLQNGVDGELRIPEWMSRQYGGGAIIPLNVSPDRALAKKILRTAIRLPAGICRFGAIDRHIETLERRLAELDLQSWHRSPSLRGELVLTVDATGRGRLNEYELFYSGDTGLEFHRDDRIDGKAFRQ